MRVERILPPFCFGEWFHPAVSHHFLYSEFARKSEQVARHGSAARSGSSFGRVMEYLRCPKMSASSPCEILSVRHHTFLVCAHLVVLVDQRQ